MPKKRAKKAEIEAIHMLSDLKKLQCMKAQSNTLKAFIADFAAKAKANAPKATPAQKRSRSQGASPAKKRKSAEQTPVPSKAAGSTQSGLQQAIQAPEAEAIARPTEGIAATDAQKAPAAPDSKLLPNEVRGAWNCSVCVTGSPGRDPRWPSLEHLPGQAPRALRSCHEQESPAADAFHAALRGAVHRRDQHASIQAGQAAGGEES